MRLTSMVASFVLAFLGGLFVTEANGQQQELTSNVFATAAPDECLAFSAWGGQQEFNSGSNNATERLMTEPEVKAFADDLIRRVGLMIPAMDSGESTERNELLHKLGPKLANAILTKPGSFFVESFELDDRGEPRDLKAAMLVDAGVDAVALAGMLTELVDNGELRKKQIAGENFSIISMNEDPGVELCIGNAGNVLVVAVGEKTVSDTIARIKAQKVPGFLEDFRSANGIKNMNSLSYINIRSVRRMVTDVLGNEAATAFSFVGLANAQSLETCNGLGQDQWLSRMLLRIDGRPEGLLDLSDADGLSAEDLRLLPKDSLFALGVSLDAQRAVGLLRMAVAAMSNGREDLNQAFQEIQRETGVDLQNDVIANLGSSWTLYNGAGDGWFSGLTMTTSVKDAKALNRAAETIIKSAMIEMRGDRYAPEFLKRKVGEHSITSIRTREFPLPVEPSWCIANGQFIIGLYPQAVESALKRTTPEVLVGSDQDQFLRSSFVSKPGKTSLIGMGYVDAVANFEISYPYMQVMSSMGASMMEEFTRSMPAKQGRRVGALLSGIRLPRARVIHRHLRPSLLAIRQSEVGVELEASQTIPSMDVGYIAPLGVAVLLPAVQATRGAARRTVSANNMRQQVLAALNYESAHMHFPQGYSVDEQGNKLLSWRVHVLPFIEQNNLYQQFNLDEPWDSPNNKKLLKNMPEVFRSPVSSAGDGMTVYRGIGGESGVLRGPSDGRRKIGFRNITDGSSNTIFLMETSDELAVEWTKPDEGINPDQFERAKLFGAYPGGTNIGRCDGSIHFLSDKTETEKLQHMMKMNDGNIVDWGEEEYMSPRRRRRQRMKDLGPIDPRFVLDGNVQVMKLENMLNDGDRAKLAQQDVMNNFRQIALSMHNFESAYRGFPSAYSASADRKPLLSWRVHVLPFLEQNQLYEQFRLDEPWDSPNNRALIEKMPSFYVVDANTPTGKTSIVGIGGEQGVIGTQKLKPGRNPSGIGFGQITDGSSNTILLIDAGTANAVEWTKPQEFEPTAEIIGQIIKNGSIVAMGDGSIATMKKDVQPEILKALLTMNGGEIISESDWRE